MSWRPSRILAPYDGSPAANAAVGPAAELACKTGGELLVVQVGTAGVGAPAERGSLTIPLYVDQPQHEWPSWSGELLERLVCLCPDVQLRARLYVRGGEPGPEITRVATEESADLIVLAWKGEWAGEHANTLKNVVRDAPCPTMIVHA
jgi:nucleotide-binding universal stress UspA family protein